MKPDQKLAILLLGPKKGMKGMHKEAMEPRKEEKKEAKMSPSKRKAFEKKEK